MYTINSFFSGVGGIDLGFEMTKNFKVIWANEIDVNASKTYALNFSNTLITEDIKKIESNDVPNADIFIAGFPCQAFSVAGYKKGFEDERGILFFDLLRIIKEHKPRVVFLENVKNLVGHDNGNTFRVIKESLEFYGYKVRDKVLNAKDYGNIPQNRERIYIVAFIDPIDYMNFDYPDSIPLEKTIKDMIDYSVDDQQYIYTQEKYESYEEIKKSVLKKNTVYQWRRKYVRENKSNVFPTLTANMGTGGHNVPLILTDKCIRKLTPRECFNVQGYPLNFKLPNISNSHLYKQAGNSVVVPVIERIAQNISKALKQTDNLKVFN
jgi:DNA (cytosine-5)-methyltransferase 1